MNKKVVLILLFLISSAVVFGQAKPFRFGIKVSPNISWLQASTEGYTHNGTNFGFGWGFISDFSVADNYFIATGFDVIFNGGELSYPYVDNQLGIEGTLCREYNLKYFQIPVTLKMRTNKFGSYAFFGNLGLGSAIRIGAKANEQFEYIDTNGETTKTDEMEHTIADEINLFKASMIFGIGMEYYVDESTSIVFVVNYNNGFTNVLNGYNTVDPSLKEKAQLHYFEFSIGIIF